MWTLNPRISTLCSRDLVVEDQGEQAVRPLSLALGVSVSAPPWPRCLSGPGPLPGWCAARALTGMCCASCEPVPATRRRTACWASWPPSP